MVNLEFRVYNAGDRIQEYDLRRHYENHETHRGYGICGRDVYDNE
jgi:hypothetical protein